MMQQMMYYPNSNSSSNMNYSQSKMVAKNNNNNNKHNVQQNYVKPQQFFMPLRQHTPQTQGNNFSSQGQYQQQQFSSSNQGSQIPFFKVPTYQNTQNINNIDQYSEHSTSCGSEENNQDDFLETLLPIVKQQPLQSGWINKPKSQQQQQQQQQCVPEEAKYKTEMCKNWVETGKCNYGEKCKFAHGKTELVQKVAANKLFKTKPCKQFFEHSTCSYGHRCHFLHDVRSFSEIISANFYQKRLDNLSETNSQSPSESGSSSRLPIFQKISMTSADNQEFQLS